MIKGVNWTEPAHHGIVQALIRDGAASFCEVLIDNFLHLRPRDLARALPDVPLAFHVMRSRFLERGEDELREISARLRIFREALRPIYVSDHVAAFHHRGRRLPWLMEIDYEDQYEHCLRRVSLWQEMLGARLHLENFPSIDRRGQSQAEFFRQLTRRTGAGVLFDFSNALVARINCGLACESWDEIIRDSRHFHVAGYRLSQTEPSIALDTHDVALSADSAEFVRRALAGRADDPEASLVVERDDAHGDGQWRADLESLA